MLLAALALAAAIHWVPASPAAPQSALPASATDAGGGAGLEAAFDPAPATSPAAGEVSAKATRELLRTTVPPARNEADVRWRFEQACGTPQAPAIPYRPQVTPGETRTFNVLDEPNHRYFQVRATLRQASEHLLLYIQDGISVNQEALAATAAVFEERTYPTLRRYFGALSEEPQITVFNGRVPGVGGYFSASDLYPRAVNDYSNERVMVYMSTDAARPGTPNYDGILAHEVQHFIHWALHPQQDSWVNEGASELAMALTGYDQSQVARSFLNNPQTQLNAWSEPAQSTPHYGAGYAFLEYFAQRFGGYDSIAALITTPGTSTNTFEQYLARRGARFDDLFRDFVIANLLNDRAIADGRYGYEKLPGIRARVQQSLPAVRGTSVFSAELARPYSTRYVEITPPAAPAPPGQGSTLELRFGGAAHAGLFSRDARGGQAQWWGHATDEMEATLTREFDLRGVTSATLSFSLWYETEQDYDYAGVAASTDGGCTWQTLAGNYTTNNDPLGQNLGHGYTGRSGGGEQPAWVQEEMDLSRFAGQQVQLRFYNLTDQSYHLSGVAVDDIAIPEIGFLDDGESDRGWELRGFLRAANAAAVDWAVQVVAYGDGVPQVLPLTTMPETDGAPATGRLDIPGFGPEVRRVVVAISPMVPVTLIPVEYRLEASLR